MIYVWIGALIFHREVNKEVVSVCESLCESYYRNDKLRFVYANYQSIS